MNTVLYFTATWCDPCKKVKPIVEDLIRDGANIKIIDVDVETNLVNFLEIMSVPTFVVMKDDIEIYRTTGPKTRKELKELLRYDSPNLVAPVNSLSTFESSMVLSKEEKTEKFIIYFTADWCKPCRLTTPFVEALNEESKTRKFFIVNIDEAIKMKEDFQIDEIPAFVFIKNEEEVRRETGIQRKDKLVEFLNYLEQ